MISDMQMTARMGGRRLEIMSRECPVSAINASVHIIETTTISKGVIIVFTDLNKTKSAMLISDREMIRYIARFFCISFI